MLLAVLALNLKAILVLQPPSPTPRDSLETCRLASLVYAGFNRRSCVKGKGWDQQPRLSSLPHSRWRTYTCIHIQAKRPGGKDRLRVRVLVLAENLSSIPSL